MTTSTGCAARSAGSIVHLDSVKQVLAPLQALNGLGKLGDRLRGS